MSVHAISKSVRISPRKIMPVASLVRGRSVSDAITILEHTPRRGAAALIKTIKSASANAENNHSYKPNSLVISQVSITADQRYKRYRPAARGRALKFERKTSQIKVVVNGEKRTPKKASSASNKSDKESK